LLHEDAGPIFQYIVSLPLIVPYKLTLYVALLARYEHCIELVPVYIRVTLDPLYDPGTFIIHPLDVI